jgi:hypothetical protein
MNMMKLEGTIAVTNMILKGMNIVLGGLALFLRGLWNLAMDVEGMVELMDYRYHYRYQYRCRSPAPSLHDKCAEWQNTIH